MDKDSTKGYEFTKANFADFKRFWESETGEKYLEKIKETRKQLLQVAMGSYEKDQVFRSVAIANGLDSILLDIQATIDSATKNEKEDTKEAKKK